MMSDKTEHSSKGDKTGKAVSHTTKIHKMYDLRVYKIPTVPIILSYPTWVIEQIVI